MNYYDKFKKYNPEKFKYYQGPKDDPSWDVQLILFWFNYKNGKKPGTLYGV